MIDILGFKLGILNFIVLFPLLGAVVVALLPRENPNLARGVALVWSIIVLFPTLLVFGLTLEADLGPGEYAFQSNQDWFGLIGASWHFGVDGISASMMLLTAILTPLAMIVAFEHDENPSVLMSLMLFMQTGMMGVFGTLDMLVFFLFYEVGLVPMYFMIYLWGGKNRDFASRKFFIFTMAGSLGLLLTIQLIAIVVGRETGVGITFDLIEWQRVWPETSLDATILGFNVGVVKWLAFIGFTLAFALKIPIFPFHTWLPDAHTEAPTAGSMLLAGVLLKLGAYGFLRLVIPLFPLEWVQTRSLGFFGNEIPGLEFQATEVFAALAMLSIVLGAFSAWAQDDFKKLVAYSSVNHMGFVAMGLVVFAAVYGTNFAMSAENGTRPDLVLSAFGENMDEESALEVAGAAQVAATARIEYASYVKLYEEYDAVLTCGTPTPENFSQCAIVSIPRVSADSHSAVVAGNGAVLQMFNHGLSAAGMFLLVGALYHKAHTRDLRRFGGLWHIVPGFGAALVFVSMASLGLPGLNGFVGEYLVVAGAFPVDGFEVYVLISMVGLLITGAYILKGLQKVLHGPVNEEWKDYHENEHSLEITRREMIALAPLIVLMLVTGVFPNWILPAINQSVDAMLALVSLGG